MNPDTTAMQLVLVTGMSGSGKSVALHALEDAGFYCVDNLPPQLLESFLDIVRAQGTARVAVAIDVRSAQALPGLAQRLQTLREQGLVLNVLFLDTTTDTLVRRFSETRRLHPLSLKDTQDQRRALIEAIELERDLLSELRDQAQVLDTSQLRAAHLRSEIKSLLLRAPATLTLVFESFAYKRGIPMDADFVFDVRMLPNPHYEPGLKTLTGLDAPVAAYLAAEPEVTAMAEQITRFVQQWLPRMLADHRSYVTVAVGCTGGQHRSVYLVEQLAQAFSGEGTVHRRHRELDARAHAHN
jgi:RNase adapter protein RapZ